jgi:hypothetical protein
MPRYTDTDIDEDMKLTRGDYIKILHHYQPRLRKTHSRDMSMSTAKIRAHRILAGKLCRCIKPPKTAASTSTQNPADDDEEERRRIAYCTRSIFINKGLRRHGFRCKTATGALRPRFTRNITKRTRRLRLSTPRRR